MRYIYSSEINIFMLEIIIIQNMNRKREEWMDIYVCMLVEK